MSEQLETGRWCRVTSGPHKGKEGVIDSFQFWAGHESARVINPHTRVNHGWFRLADLMLTTPPVYESSVDMAPLLDIVMGRGRA